MPTIPVYNREVSLQPQFTEMNNVRATPEAFGAAVGRGMQDIGQGIDQISKAKFTLEQKLQENEGRAAVLRYENSKNQTLLDPDAGIMTRTGVNARGAAKAWQDKAAELRAAASEGLTGAGLEYFNRIVDQDIVQTSGTVLSHEATEMKKGVDQSFVSLIDTYSENAVTYLNDPVASSAAIDNGIQMIRERAVTQGWDKATSDNLVAQFMSDTHKNIALTIAATDPLKAQAYIDENREEMTAEGSNYQSVAAVLKEAVTLRQADQAASAFFTTSRPGVDVENVGDAAKARFAALQEAWGKPLTITSGYRDPAYNKKVGGAKDSQHTHGNAFDVDVSGMSIEERQQLIVAARQAGFAGVGVYGNSLHFDVAGERAWGDDYTSATVPEWAKEALTTPTGAGGGTAAPDAGGGGGGGGGSVNVMDPAAVEDYIASLPADVQDLTRKKIYSYFENVAKAETANRNAAKQTLWDTILQTGALPTDVSVLSAAGMEAVSAAQTYLDRGAPPEQTNESEFRKLIEMKAGDREAFVKVDLNEYRNLMTEADFSALQKDQRTMLEQGAAQLDFKVAHDLSKQVVEAQIGPAPSTSEAEDRAAYDARLNAFYRAVEADMRAYQQANKVVPLYDDILKMVTARALPTIEAEDGWGSEATGMQFEMSDPLLPGFKLDAEAIVPRIPLDIYSLIIADLKAQGIPQTPEEIASAYENYLLWDTVNSND